MTATRQFLTGQVLPLGNENTLNERMPRPFDQPNEHSFLLRTGNRRFPPRLASLRLPTFTHVMAGIQRTAADDMLSTKPSEQFDIRTPGCPLKDGETDQKNMPVHTRISQPLKDHPQTFQIYLRTSWSSTTCGCVGSHRRLRLWP